MSFVKNASLQAQIDDLQTRVAFQEDAIQIMSEQLAVQAESLHFAREHIHLLNQKMNEILVQAEDNTGSAQNERPPHY